MKKSDCIFCKIANGDISSATLYEDEDFRVILDLNPGSKGHALILPKSHADDLCSLDFEMAKKVLPLAGKIGQALMNSLSCDGFNLVQNNGEAAGQTIPHFHMHVIPRYKNESKIVTWKPESVDMKELTKIAEQIKTQL